MNRNALTEQRRETVIGLLKGMNIKKNAVEGFDKDDVYDCMQQLCDLYEKNIEELENAYESEINQLKERYQKYDENNELYVSLIMEAKKSSNEIITQAKTEVESILAEGKEKVAKQEAELAQLRLDVETEKQVMIAELNAAKDAVEAEKAAMKADVEAEREKTTVVKNKFTQQINAMEEEFEEIKTNILRTAGKIDSLKSKLPLDEEAEWNMMNDLDGVGFPVSDVEIDSVLDTPIAVDNVDIELPVEPIIEVAEEPTSGIPVTEIPAEQLPEEIQMDEIVEETIPSLENKDEVFTLEDLTASISELPLDENPADEAEKEILSVDDIFSDEEVEELSLDDIEIELPELIEEPAIDGESAENDFDEISLEGLEELFKTDK